MLAARFVNGYTTVYCNNVQTFKTPTALPYSSEPTPAFYTTATFSCERVEAFQTSEITFFGPSSAQSLLLVRSFSNDSPDIVSATSAKN